MRLVGRPKLQDSRPCSTRLSEATEDSLPCSTRLSEVSEADPQSLFEELTGDLSSLAEAPEAPPEVSLEEALMEQHQMPGRSNTKDELQRAREELDQELDWELSSLAEAPEAPPEVSLEEALEVQHQMPGRSNTKEELQRAREELDRERVALRQEKEALEAQRTMEAESVREHVSPTQPDDLEELLEAEYMTEAETVQEHVLRTQPEAPWVPHISAESEGLVYYHNVKTGEVTWDKPAPEALQVTEWVMHTSPEGKPYFYNEKTLETSWELVPGGIVKADKTSANAAEFAKASEYTMASDAESTPARNRAWEAPSPLWEAPAPILPRLADPAPRIDQGAVVRTRRMDAGFEKWAMSLCVEMAPRGGEAQTLQTAGASIVGGPPPARKAPSAAPMMSPPG